MEHWPDQSYLKFCAYFWAPQFKRDAGNLEHFLKRSMRIEKDLELTIYTESVNA